MNFTVFSLAILSIFLIVYTLVIAQSFFVPLVIALVIGYLIISVVEAVERVTIKGRRLPLVFSYIFSLVLLTSFALGGFSVISDSILSLMQQAPIYQQKLQQLGVALDLPIKDFASAFEHVDVVFLLSKVFVALGQIAQNTGLIAIYVLFILLEHRWARQKFALFLPYCSSPDAVVKIINKVAADVQSYLKLKTLLSFVTALVSYVILYAVGVDFAEFWAFLIFLLNFIPSIGSIIATIFPVALSLIQFESVVPFIIVASSLTLLQVTMGNIIEPRIMGKLFNLSGIVVVVSLVIWGQIWGVVGMIVGVPLVIVLSIILSNFETTLPIVILLSKDGKVK